MQADISIPRAFKKFIFCKFRLDDQLTTQLLQQVPRNCISHAKPRSNWLGHTALWCHTFIWNLTKAILNRKACQIWFSGSLFNQPFTSNCCTRPWALEEHKQTHRTRRSSLLTAQQPFLHNSFQTLWLRAGNEARLCALPRYLNSLF